MLPCLDIPNNCCHASDKSTTNYYRIHLDFFFFFFSERSDAGDNWTNIKGTSAMHVHHLQTGRAACPELNEIHCLDITCHRGNPNY